MKDIRMLVLDIDGTVLDDSQPTKGLITLNLLLEQRRDQIQLVFATGRSLISTLKLVDEGILFPPDAVASFLGTELWVPPWEQPDPSFEGMVRRGWDRNGVKRTLARFDSITPQPKKMQSPWKVSCYLEAASDVPLVETALSDRGIDATILYSCGRFLDVIPVNAGKRAAVDYLRKSWRIDRDDILVGGNSGNDLDMLEDPRLPAVVVGNREDELQDLSQSEQVYQADAPFAAGVLEGAEAHAFWPRLKMSTRAS